MAVTVITTILTAAPVPPPAPPAPQAGAYDLTSLAILKDELQITDTSQDVFLQRVLTQVSKAVSTYCNRVFQKETLRDDIWPDRDSYPYYVPGGFAPLQLSRSPSGNYTTVTENGITLTVANGDFVNNDAKGQLIRLNPAGFPTAWPSFPISVTYDGGFSSIPENVALAAILAAKQAFYLRKRDPLLRSENVPGVLDLSYYIPGRLDGGWSSQITDLLDPFRTPVVA